MHAASLLTPEGGHVHVLQPSSAVYESPGQQCPCAIAGGAGGHVIVVQIAALLVPFTQRHVFMPSPAGNAEPLVHRSLCSAAGHRIDVHVDSFFSPLKAQVHVLHPSAAVNDTPGQHRSLSLRGAIGHAHVVQVEGLLTPFCGHVQVLTPSPAGYAVPGTQPVVDAFCAGQVTFVHRDSFLKPL